MVVDDGLGGSALAVKGAGRGSATGDIDGDGLIEYARGAQTGFRCKPSCGR